ncbi:MAG TPA: hypothetical protein VGG57_06390 [Stellaceae bacterium]|jgi:hypothetical protein
MRDRFVLFAGLGLTALIAARAPAFASPKTADNPDGCQIIQRHHDGSADNSGSLSSSVTAGGGHVSGSSSAGGESVSVHSGTGNGSSVATSTTSGGGTTTAMVSNSDGSCTIYVDPGKS